MSIKRSRLHAVLTSAAVHSWGQFLTIALVDNSFASIARSTAEMMKIAGISFLLVVVSSLGAQGAPTLSESFNATVS